MSLYEDCETFKRPKPYQAQNPGIDFLESHLRTRKASTSSKHSRTSSTLAPVIDLQTRKKPSVASSTTKSILKSTSTKSKNRFYLDPQYDWGYEDEYDPVNFNNYFTVRAELEEWRRTKEKEKRVKKTKNFLSNYGYDSDDGDSADERETKSCQRKRGVEFAPPPSILEPTQIYNTESNLYNQATSTKSGEDVAAKIMAKYGFKGGHGLGKDEQGMSTALQVQRTVRNCGRIIHEKDLMSSEIDQHKVLLLCNVVGPDEVDDELEQEIRDECNSKYGEVVQVLIHERSDRVAAEEAIRVFVEFARAEDAHKALTALNGRYFGGRVIKAAFYNFDRYKTYNLND